MKTLKDIRGYGLGERNPKTLPDGSKERESVSLNEARTAFWAEVRKLCQADRLPKKYAH